MYLIGSQKKVLGYVITANEPAITLRHPELDGRLSLTLDGKIFNCGQVMGLVIQNLGMKDIEDHAGVTVLHAHCFSSTLAIRIGQPRCVQIGLLILAISTRLD
jgi:hypothetical protein